jgi:hypothetical protein
MNAVQSLDQQYLDFAAKTDLIFAEYPQIEPLRYFIFKELLVQRRSLGCDGYLKHWLRPLLRRAQSRGRLDRADVLIWLESCREVIVDALLPVYREITSRGTKVELVSFQGPDDLPPSTLRFQFPAHSRLPGWAKSAWEALCDVVEGLRYRPLRRCFNYSCAIMQGFLDELDRILEAVEPKTLLNASTQLIGGAGVVVASRSRGVMTLLLQHGIVQPFYTPLLADYMLTWGETSNEALVKLGVPRQRLIAVGSPRHDCMGLLQNGNARAALLHSLSLPSKPILVFFSNGNDLVRNGRAPIECARWLDETAAQYSNDINVVVRLHPNEDGSLYRSCRHLRVTKNTPELSITLAGCDCVASLCSTVLYEALLYKKPIWQFYADEWPDLADNWKCGLALRVSSPAELSKMMNRMLRESDAGLLADVSSRVFAKHGRATQAVADFVQSQLEAGTSNQSVRHN